MGILENLIFRGLILTTLFDAPNPIRVLQACRALFLPAPGFILVPGEVFQHFPRAECPVPPVSSDPGIPRLVRGICLSPLRLAKLSKPNQNTVLLKSECHIQVRLLKMVYEL